MRKGNKSKLLAALLAAGLVFNAFAFAPLAQEEVEMVLDFVELPNETPQVGETQGESEAQVQAAVDEVGQNVLPGKVIEYGGKLYKVVGTNFINNGEFESAPFIRNPASGVDQMFLTDNTYEWTTAEAHAGNHSLKISGEGANWIWRHAFSADVTYVYSVWYKFEGNVNFDDGFRHVAGTVDVVSGSQHNNQIGKNVDITYGWQQDMCVFRGRGTDQNFSNYFVLNGSGTLYVDDMVVYEVEELDTLNITQNTLEDDDWNSYTQIPGPGSYVHNIVYQNNSTSPLKLKGVIVLFKDNKLEKISTVDATAKAGSIYDGVLTPGNNVISIPLEIEEGEDVSRYHYLAYISSTNNPFYIYGAAKTGNPVKVIGASSL